MDFFSSIIGFILAIGILVTVHEFGHFWVARSLGVKVLKFSIGFGKPLWSRIGRRDNTEYAISMIPLGGFVKMLDEGEGDVLPEEAHRAFNRKPLWVRTAVVLAGPAFNFLFAIIAYWTILTIGVEGLQPVVGTVVKSSIAQRAGIEMDDRLLTIDGRPIQTWSEHRLYMKDRLLDGDSILFALKRQDGSEHSAELQLPEGFLGSFSPTAIESQLGIGPKLPILLAIVGSVSPESPASDAGLLAGDKILAINDVKVDNWSTLVKEVTPKASQKTRFEVLRQDELVGLTIVPEPIEVNGTTIGRIGIGPQFTEPGAEFLAVAELGFSSRVYKSLENTWLMSALTLKMLYRMLKLEVSVKNLSGPITIAHYAGQTVQIGVIPFLTFLAVVSISLGVLNLLPIPVLDGGHLLYYAIELVKGSPVSERVMIWGQQLGIVILACLMGIAFYNDILRLFE